MSLVVRDKRLRPRKTARQDRARDTRARILVAARRVFAQHGYAAGTTNRIAEAAGLSIGSLYQYFPNKDAILVELVDAHIDAGTRALTEVVDGLLARHRSDLPALVDLLDIVVAALIELHATDRRFHRVMFEEAPRPPDVLDFVAAFEVEIVDRVVAVLSTHPEVRVADVRLAARITITIVEALIHRLATDDHRHQRYPTPPRGGPPGARLPDLHVTVGRYEPRCCSRPWSARPEAAGTATWCATRRDAPPGAEAAQPPHQAHPASDPGRVIEHERDHPKRPCGLVVILRQVGDG